MEAGAAPAQAAQAAQAAPRKNGAAHVKSEENRT